MMCQSCNKKAARVHLTEIGSKMKKEIHLCEVCAKEHEASLPHTVGSTAPPHLEAVPGPLVGGSEEEADKAGSCKTCGVSFSEFRSTGRLGCPDDYEFFRESLVPILERIHGAARHRGKVPPQAGERTIRQRDLMKLSDELERAVKSEKYEDAARLRDRLERLREEINAD